MPPMPAEYLIVKIFGATELRRKLQGIAARTFDPVPALELIAEDIRQVEKAVFSSQGRRGGGSWKFLDPKTVERKGSDIILIDTGALLRSVSEADSEYSDVYIDRSTLNFGTTHPAAKAMQFGDPKHNIPARPFLRFTMFDHARWRRIIADYIAGRI